MSQENVEVMRQWLDAFDRRDRTTWLALCDPQYEVIPSDSWPEAGVIRGPEAAWDFYVGVAEAFERRSIRDVDIVDTGADKVVVHQRHEVRGRTSGIDVEVDYWVVVTFRDGRRLLDQWFSDQSDALEAAGSE
jgi:ketosteroid isomerase-like protein